MTKAEKIFKDTYQACRKHLRDFGYEYNPNGKPVSFGSLITEEATSTRTWNAIQKYIDSERRNLKEMKELEILEPEKIKLYETALEMVQVTLDTQRANWKAFLESLK